MFSDCYQEKDVFVTGHTGFKGGWLSLWLKSQGARVHGFSLGSVGRPSFYETLEKSVFASETKGDVRDLGTLKRSLKRIKPAFIFHLAAQSLVRKSYAEPMATMSTNVLGAVNLMEAARQVESSAIIVVVTTDKCYENRNWTHGYRECDPLGGHDIYSASKAAAEILTHAWRRSFFDADSRLGRVATARGGNVIGGGDYAADRILPDFVRAQLRGEALEVRNPAATRPWQHVLDCLGGYLRLGEKLSTEPDNAELHGAFNFGPDAKSNRSVGKLIEQASKTWPGDWKTPRRKGEPHEAAMLHLSTDKAASLLNWFPVWNFEEAVGHALHWYRRRHAEKARRMAAFSREQIALFSAQARERQIGCSVTR